MDWKPLLWDIFTYVAFGSLCFGAPKMLSFIRRRQLRRSVEEVFLACRGVCVPSTLSNPDEANLLFMAHEAQDSINLLLHRLDKAGLYPPEAATTENLDVWFKYLGKIRKRL